MVIKGFITDNWDTAFVMVDGSLLLLERSQEVRNHSPDGFAWGYGGSGPTQLALAILLEAGVSERDAETLHHEFRRTYIESLSQEENWTLDLDVRYWVDERLAVNE